MSAKKQYYENLAQTIIKKMAKRQMEAFYCPDRASAVSKALELMPEGSSISWGGSMTIDEMGLKTVLRESNFALIDRDEAKTATEKKAKYAEIIGCDYFLTSSNAITLDGELVNYDGRGNRVAFLCFGPEHVLVFAGMNKVVPDVASGIARVQNMAAPPNTVRLKKNTPCAVTGRCGDCYGSDSVCSQLVVTRRSHEQGRIKVILIGEEMGY